MFKYIPPTNNSRHQLISCYVPSTHRMCCELLELNPQQSLPATLSVSPPFRWGHKGHRELVIPPVMKWWRRG